MSLSFRFFYLLLCFSFVFPHCNTYIYIGDARACNDISDPCPVPLVCEKSICHIPKMHPCDAEVGPMCTSGTWCMKPKASLLSYCVTPARAGSRCGDTVWDMCTPGLSCETGRCVKKVPEGALCSVPNVECEAGMKCLGDSVLSRCIKMLNVGEKCNDLYFVHCDDDKHLACDHDQNKCVLNEGTVCNLENQMFCKSGMKCILPFDIDNVSMARRCITPRTIGEQCGKHAFCDEGLVCQSSVCRKPKDGECSNINPMLCMHGTHCVGAVGWKKRCESIVPLFGRCDISAPGYAQCNATLVCDTRSRSCRVPKHGVCDRDNECQRDFKCMRKLKSQSGKCVPIRRAGENCGKKNEESVCKDELLCERGVCRIRLGGTCAQVDQTNSSTSLCISGCECRSVLISSPRTLCMRVRKLNEFCKPSSYHICRESLLCETGTQRCKKDLHATCERSTECRQGTRCVGINKNGRKKCLTVLKKGEACGNIGLGACDREKGLACVKWKCQEQNALEEWANCARTDTKCAQGLDCVGVRSIKYCVRLGRKGEPCNNENVYERCVIGLKCIHHGPKTGICQAV